MDLQSVADKIEIHELLARYARGVDTHDWELWRSVFTDDAVVDGPSATGGHYEHELVRTPAGWKSAHLVEHPMWFVNPPELG